MSTDSPLILENSASHRHRWEGKPALSAEDRAQILSWNRTRSDFPSEKCMHQLFEEQVQRTPDACAVVFKDQQLTYRELNERANQVAHELRNSGVVPETLVGICVERSLEMAVGLLGILKAGGAYVPLDPNYPEDRLNIILSEARTGALVTQHHLTERFPEHNCPMIVVDAEPTSTTQARTDNFPMACTPDNLAYAIFTSGSTGKPKGVLISHRSLVNHSTAMARQYALACRDRVLQFASFSFDVAAEEMFPTWLSGGAVVVWPVASGVAPIRSFLEFVEQNEITVLNLPAPYWHEWTLELERHEFPSRLRLVVVGSDKVSAEKYASWQNHVGERVRWYNAYGPTETTITATIYEPSGSPEISTSDCLPIGRPIANTQVYVLDENLTMLSIGVAGELHIGGIGLARGYLHQPELTAQKFVRNPFSGGGEERLYKTGDLVRYLPDGNLEFLGRVDDQIKIRGYRIETGEVETALQLYPGIRRAVVMGREDEPGEKHLVAYLVAEGGERPSPEALKEFLKHRLPDYMIPVGFIMLKRLPLTPGGKVDRRQLPPLPRTRVESRKEYRPPKTELECKLVEIWESMLGVKPIGICDNFFELGGHSLLEVRLVAEVEKRLGITLPLTTLYYTRTIESLAKILQHKKNPAGQNSLLHPYQTDGSKPPIFSHGGSTHLAYYLGADQPVYWLELHGMNGLEMPATIEEMAADYVKEIRLARPHGPYFLLGYSMGGLVMFDVAQQLSRLGERIALLVLIDPTAPHVMGAKKSVVNHPTQNHPGTFVHRARQALSAGFRENLRRTPGRIRGRMRWANRIAKRAFCRVWLRCGYRLPPSQRLFYYQEREEEVIRRYVPQLYRGSFVLFRRPDNATESKWRDLATGEVEIHDTWVDHNEFLEEPYVQILAGKIKSHLQDAQAASGDGDSNMRGARSARTVFNK